MTKEFREYLAEIEKALRAGNATEHTHRPALKGLLQSLASGITATNEPKRVECGAPDFRVSRDTRNAPQLSGTRKQSNSAHHREVEQEVAGRAE
jgi:hypothetical protein